MAQYGSSSSSPRGRRATALFTALAATLLGSSQLASAATCIPRNDPFAVIDPQDWVNPDNMTWADFKAPPGTTWNDASVKGSIRNFNIALVVADFDDESFVITRPVGSSVFGNPQPIAGDLNITRDNVPAFYRDLLNLPSDLNEGHTMHEYWMEDSQGRFGVDLTVYGPYRMPSLSFQYGIDEFGFNPLGCPEGYTCEADVRTDALGLWRAAVGNDTADSFELIFVLTAGQDESSTWQEFGEMKFLGPDDVPSAFGPPGGVLEGNVTQNWADTRYVNWTSWASAAAIWPNAGGGSSIQAESSGMGTYSHELSHLLSIGDNYNNPFSVPKRRDYTGPWSMMSRGSFNGPGGPHTRWHIPSLLGGSMGSLHTMRDKVQLGLISNDSTVRVSREALPASGLVLATITARSVHTGLMGVRTEIDADNSPACDTDADPFCDGGSYNGYDLEVVDRMGADSFQMDAGVMLSKTKIDGFDEPFQWTIDANPEDIHLVDFIRPNGSAALVTIGDYRQLADALFHAGTRSGSQYEYVDEANDLHFYVVDKFRDSTGVLSYTVAVKSVAGGPGPSKHGVSVAPGTVVAGGKNTPTANGVTCAFKLTNTGSFVAADASAPQHPQDVTAWLSSDIFRLSATVTGSGWKIALPNELSTAKFGATTTAQVAVAASADAADAAVVTLTATSESDPSVIATAECAVAKS